MARRVVRRLESQGTPLESLARVRASYQLAIVLNAAGKFAGAEPIARDAASRITQLRPGSGFVHLYAARHGESLLGLDRLAEAAPVLLAAYDGLVAMLGDLPIRLRGTPALVRAHITKLHQSWHKADPSGGHDAALPAWKAKHP